MRHLSSLLLVVVVLLSGMFGQPAQTSSQSSYDPNELLIIKPELREEVAASLPEGLTKYEIFFNVPKIDENNEYIAVGDQRVTVTNTTDTVLTELPFRLYANGAAYESSPLEITSASIAGEAVDWLLSESDSIATIPLPHGLEPGASIIIEMEFELTVPIDDASHYGILNYSPRASTSVLAHWYPILAGWDPDTGWMLKPTSIFGDPIFSDAGMYEVTITAPASQTLITSGVETARSDDDNNQTVTYSAKPSRDFLIVMTEDLQPLSTEVEGTTVTSWAQPKHAPGSELTLQWMANALEVFNPLLGEYPWVQLQSIDALVYAAAAVEMPQMLLMDTSFYGSPPAAGQISYFEFTVVHEVVHMWFYALVGNNQYDHAFIDEGLTNYLSGDVYFRKHNGDEIGEEAFQTFLYRPFKRMIESNADVIVDFPTDDFPTSSVYASAVYTKAPMGFRAIHQAMGDAVFFSALTTYVAEFRFQIATPADLEAAFQAKTDIDMHELWSHWFERREGALDIRGE